MTTSVLQTPASKDSAGPTDAVSISVASAVSTPAALRRFLHGLPGVDQVGCEARVATLSSRSIKTTSKALALDLAISMIDLTTLEGQDTTGKVRALCAKAQRPDPEDGTCPRVAAICVYPDMVATARSALGESGVHVASVATAFPSGRASLAVKLQDTRDAVAAGARRDRHGDRPWSLLVGRLSCGSSTRSSRSRTSDAACAHLKVILETGELMTYDNVRRASWLAMLAGADFIKTSTGKVPPAATMPVTLVMLEAVRDFRDATGRQVGVKPAGGISTAKDAIKYLVMVNETLGEDWLDPGLVPLRCVQVAQRPAHAAHQADHRALRRPRLLHLGLKAAR
ncbi:MAG: deoxyribose-phosphate aldolase [Nocardioidaceae bacterium]